MHISSVREAKNYGLAVSMKFVSAEDKERNACRFKRTVPTAFFQMKECRGNCVLRSGDDES